MEIKLLKENDPILKQTATNWDFTVDGDPSDIIMNMTKIMIENNGIGLAGPQVGVSKRMFIMGNKDKMFACINPEIIEADGNIMDMEGCLSFPELWLRVRRADKIKVRYNNALGELVEAEFSGLISRVFQHEYDHLDGICFDTRVGKLSLEMAKNRRKKRSRKTFN
jgi:peptide deformylase